ncbi:hypothetical protein [Shewanella surugensis]|uniref:Uncharacterized protein n=1 Tax=Shewanella surugensis TaxID=212020 RepID=A0ABT0LIM6_9GAMM|nr:hypothetical protein [Shewanella surugensis]MCL1127562.1 hypothetical protein [Shewanella surugensis]
MYLIIFYVLYRCRSFIMLLMLSWMTMSIYSAVTPENDLQIPLNGMSLTQQMSVKSVTTPIKLVVQDTEAKEHSVSVASFFPEGNGFQMKKKPS